MGVVELKYELDMPLTLNEFKKLYNFLKSYFCFDNFTRLSMGHVICENDKLFATDSHFYTARIEKRYEQLFSSYEKYNSVLSQYEDEKKIVEVHYSTVCYSNLTFTLVDKEKRIKEDEVLDFNRELVNLFNLFDVKITKGKWGDLANILKYYDLPIT